MNVRRYAAAVVYWSIATRLPWSPRPGGRIAKRIRWSLGRQMLDSCGRDVSLEKGAWFGSGKGIRVGDRSVIGLDCLVIGPLVLGDDVMMGPRCTILGVNHRTDSLDEPMNAQGLENERPVIVEDDVWIGAGSTILPGRRIGKGSIVGAGAVVTKDVEPYSIVGGNPARLLRRRTST